MNDQTIMKAINILLIDDEDLLLDIIKERLEQLGYTVYCANNGLDGIRIYNECKKAEKGIDVVITDIRMPIMDGMQVRENILSTYPDAKIILMTAFSAPPWFTDYDCKYKLEKPFNFDELIRMISMILIDTHIDYKERILFLESTVKRLLMERGELESKANILGKRHIVNISNPGKLDYNDEFLNQFGEIIRPMLHDIKGELSILLGIYETALGNTNSQLEKEDVIKLQKSFTLGINTIAHLKTRLSKMSYLGGKTPDRFSLIDLNSVIKSSLQSMRERYQGIDFEVKLEKNSLTINGNEEMLKQIIDNIVLNAIEASVPSSAQIRIITKKVSKPPLAAQISIEDNGMGILPGARSRIYDLHYTTKKSGFGIGLYIVKKAVELHRGSIYFKSHANKGTKFIVKFPLLKVS